MNDAWDESYGGDGTRGVSNSPLVLAGPTESGSSTTTRTHKTTVTPTVWPRVTAADGGWPPTACATA